MLIRQYRHGAGEVTLEIPGGMVDRGVREGRIKHALVLAGLYYLELSERP